MERGSKDRRRRGRAADLTEDRRHELSREKVPDQKDRYRPGCLAKSLAGRDKGRLYVMIRDAGEYVILTDGDIRTVTRPKRKNKKHVQLQYPQDETLEHKLERSETVSDEEIVKVLKASREASAARRNRRNV